MSDQSRILLRAAIAFGTAMIVLGFLRGIGWAAVIIGMGGGLAAGGALYLFARFADWRLARQGMDAVNANVIQERTVGVHMPVAVALEACLAALKAIPKIRILKESSITGEISARTRMSWRSYGEMVSVRVVSLAQDGATIHIRSEPISGQKVDYGKSVENVELFLRALPHGQLFG